MAADATLPVGRADRAHRATSPTTGSFHTLRISRLMVDGVVEAPQRRPLHRVPARLRPRRGLPEGVRRDRRRATRRGTRSRPSTSTCREADYQQPMGVGVMSELTATPTRAEVCVRRGGRVLPRRRRDPGQPDRHHPDDRRTPGPRDLRARPGDDRRRSPCFVGQRAAAVGVDPTPSAVRRGVEPVPADVRRAVDRQAPRDDGRQPDRPLRQPEHRLHRRLAPSPRRSCSASAARPATPSTTRPATGSRTTRPRCSSRRSTWCAASATTGPRELGAGGVALPRDPPGRHQPRRVRLRDARPRDAPALGAPRRHASTRWSRPPASSSWSPTTCRRHALPTDEELRLIREVIDPNGLRSTEVPMAMTAPAALLHTAGVRPVRRRLPDRADRHGLGGRRAADLGDERGGRARHPGLGDDDATTSCETRHRRGQGPHRQARSA